MHGAGYYASRLSGDRLRKCYEVAPPRVEQYLNAEISHVLDRVEPEASVLELGCGYGRVLAPLSRLARWVVGIDTSPASLALACELIDGASKSALAVMDATVLAFREHAFDLVVCIQNGICAFRRDPGQVLGEALRVTRPGGRLLFSSYAEAFWPHRLLWFERQAEAGLIGAIDYSETTRGEIVCRDGFRSSTFGPDAFAHLCARVGVQFTIVEVDQSSVFCEITAPLPR